MSIYPPFLLLFFRKNLQFSVFGRDFDGPALVGSINVRSVFLCALQRFFGRMAVRISFAHPNSEFFQFRASTVYLAILDA